MTAIEKYIDKKVSDIPFRNIPENLKRFWTEYYNNNVRKQNLKRCPKKILSVLKTLTYWVLFIHKTVVYLSQQKEI